MRIPVSLLSNGSVKNVTAATNTHAATEELLARRFICHNSTLQHISFAVCVVLKVSRQGRWQIQSMTKIS
jgi:hypothetical protein